MPLNYNPKDKDGTAGRAKEGTYSFKVDDAEERTFNSGNEGLRVKLLVAAFPDRDITVYRNFVYTPKALPYLEEFMTAIGLDFSKNHELYDIVGCTGRAKFKPDDDGWLEPKEFLLPSANNTQAAKKNGNATKAAQSYGPPSEDVPF